MVMKKFCDGCGKHISREVLMTIHLDLTQWYEWTKHRFWKKRKYNNYEPHICSKDCAALAVVNAITKFERELAEEMK